MAIRCRNVGADNRSVGRVQKPNPSKWPLSIRSPMGLTLRFLGVSEMVAVRRLVRRLTLGVPGAGGVEDRPVGGAGAEGLFAKAAPKLSRLKTPTPRSWFSLGDPGVGPALALLNRV